MGMGFDLGDFSDAFLMPTQQRTILAEDMVDLLLAKISPTTTPSSDGKSAKYSQYKSTKDLCVGVFHESYSPDIEEVFDSVDTNVITIVKSGNGTGKSHSAARISCGFFLRYDDAQVYTTAAPPESNLDLILWGHIKDLVQKNPEVFADFKVTSGKYIERSPLSYIIGLPIPQSANSHERKARFSGKHAPNILFVVDEGDAVPYDIYEAIESCMSGGNVRLLIMFNPRAPVGPVYNMEKKKTGHVVKVTAFNHPNVLTGNEIFKGAVDRNTTVRRINDWSVPLGPRETPDSECFKVPDFLVGCVAMSHSSVPYPPLPPGYRRITDNQFPYMVLAEYPVVAENQLINSSAIDKAVERFIQYTRMFGPVPPRAYRPIMGLDVSEYGADWNVATLRYDNYVARPEMWRYQDPDKTATDSAEIYHSNGVRYANVDANGVGAGVAPRMLRSGCDEVYGLKMQSRPDMKALSEEQKEKGEFGILRDFIWWSLKEWIEKTPMCMIPDDELLIEELKWCKYKVSKGKISVTPSDKFREKEGLGRSPDRATSLALTTCGTFEEITGTLETQNYIYGAVSHGNFQGKSVRMN